MLRFHRLHAYGLLLAAVLPGSVATVQGESLAVRVAPAPALPWEAASWVEHDTAEVHLHLAQQRAGTLIIPIPVFTRPAPAIPYADDYGGALELGSGAGLGLGLASALPSPGAASSGGLSASSGGSGGGSGGGAATSGGNAAEVSISLDDLTLVTPPVQDIVAPGLDPVPAFPSSGSGGGAWTASAPADPAPVPSPAAGVGGVVLLSSLALRRRLRRTI